MQSTQRQTSGETPMAYPGVARRGVGRHRGGHVRPSFAWANGAPRRAATTMALAAVLAVLALGGCDSLTKNDQLPTNVTDPAITETPEGALQVYRGAFVHFLTAFGQGQVPGTGGGGNASAVGIGGELSDELQNSQAVAQLGGDPAALLKLGVVDRRTVPDAGTDPQTALTYARLQKVRGQASQAIGLLQDYLPDSTALRGHAYVLAGYAEVFLAELFCSGIPLSTLDYHGDYTLKPGSSTGDVFTHAAALFDSTLKYAGGNTTVMDLARIGKARALLGQGDYTQAAATAGAVADDYTYALHYIAGGGVDSLSSLFGPAAYVSNPGVWVYSVADHEGVNGLDYVSSEDPRTATQLLDGTRIPTKYTPFDGGAPIVLASGVEARLIEAEAALQQGSAAWLDKLNALRTDGTQETVSANDPNDPNATVTQWRAGTGGVAGLAPLADPDPSAAPGPTNSRVDLLFRERAFWLFLTGHRLGDLRRLIRQYHRQPQAVYPFGPYYAHGGSYGSTVALPIPDDERKANPLFTGGACSGA